MNLDFNNPDVQNELRRMLAAGQITQDQLSQIPMSGGDSTERNQLAAMVNPVNPNESQFQGGIPQGFNPQPAPPTTDPRMLSSNMATNSMRASDGREVFFGGQGQTSNQPFANQGQPQPQPKTMKVIGLGGGQVTEIGSMAGEPAPIDYARGGIEIAGVGKAQYGKDGNAYMTNPDGSTTKIVLGYDRAASEKANDRELKRAQQMQDIAQSKASSALAQEHIAASAQARSGGMNKAPSGFEYKQDGTGLQPIAGGPADFKQQGVYNADTATLQSSMADLDRLATSANEIMKSPGLSKITGAMSIVPVVGGTLTMPGSDAADTKAKLETLKSQVGFGVLQAMRNASKTGGALGNVSDAEGKRLEANLAALSQAQSYDQYKESLQKIVDFADQAKNRLSQSYNLKYNPGTQAGGLQARQADNVLGKPTGPTFASLPNPKLFAGKRMQGPDGIYKSDGTQWVKQ